MRPPDSSRAERAAQRNIFIGWATAFAMLVARLVTVALQLSRGAIHLDDFGLAVLKSGFLILVVIYYRRHAWPAYVMFSFWASGFVLAWFLAHASLSVMAIGVVAGVGFFLGVRGCARSARCAHSQLSLIEPPEESFASDSFAGDESRHGICQVPTSWGGV